MRNLNIANFVPITQSNVLCIFPCLKLNFCSLIQVILLFEATVSGWVALRIFLCVCIAVVFSRTRRQLAALDKESQYGFSADVGEEPPDLDPALTYYQLDDGADAVFTPLLVRTRSRTANTACVGGLHHFHTCGTIKTLATNLTCELAKPTELFN